MHRNNFKSGCACIALALLVMVLPACSSKDDMTVLTLAHNLDQSHTVHKGMVYMDEQLQQYSNGKMSVKIFPGGQLGSERENIELLQIGSLAMTKVSASPLEGFVPAMKVFSLPYVFNDRDHQLRVLDSDIGTELLESLDIARLHGLGYYDAGSRSFYTTKKPVDTPADLNGSKIRVMKSQTAVRMVASLGGSPTPISLGELYTALQQGVVDGAENNPPSFYRLKHYEVARYLSLDEHTFVPDVLIMSKLIWEGLNTQQQTWLMMAVRDSIEYQRELWQADTAESLRLVEEAGVTVTRPDKKPFMQAVESMKQDYAGTETGDLLNAIKEMQ